MSVATAVAISAREARRESLADSSVNWRTTSAASRIDSRLFASEGGTSSVCERVLQTAPAEAARTAVDPATRSVV